MTLLRHQILTRVFAINWTDIINFFQLDKNLYDTLLGIKLN